MKALVIGQNEYGVLKNGDDTYDRLVTYDLRTCCGVLVKTTSGDTHLAHIDISSSPSSIERLLIEPFIQQKSNVENVTLIGNFAYFKDSSISNPQKLERMHNFNNINTCLKNAGLKPHVFQSQSGAVIISKNGEIEDVTCSRVPPELIELTTSNDSSVIKHDQAINAIANANALAQILDFDERQQAKTSLGHVARLEESSNECSTGFSR